MRRLSLWHRGEWLTTVVLPDHTALGDVVLPWSVPPDVALLVRAFAVGTGHTSHHREYRWFWEGGG
jgi:hypothetical protein